MEQGRRCAQSERRPRRIFVLPGRRFTSFLPKGRTFPVGCAEISRKLELRACPTRARVAVDPQYESDPVRRVRPFPGTGSEPGTGSCGLPWSMEPRCRFARVGSVHPGRPRRTGGSFGSRSLPSDPRTPSRRVRVVRFELSPRPFLNVEARCCRGIEEFILLSGRQQGSGLSPPGARRLGR